MGKQPAHDNRAWPSKRGLLPGRVIWTSSPLARCFLRGCVNAVRRAKLAALLAVLAACTLGIATPAGAAPFDLAGTDWEGCGELVRLARAELGGSRVVVTNQIDFHELKPDDGLLLLYPEKTLDVDELAKFMRAGGRVVMLDDFGRGDSRWNAWRARGGPPSSCGATRSSRSPSLRAPILSWPTSRAW